jgi:hypothetical protein
MLGRMSQALARVATIHPMNTLLDHKLNAKLAAYYTNWGMYRLRRPRGCKQK